MKKLLSFALILVFAVSTASFAATNKKVKPKVQAKPSVQAEQTINSVPEVKTWGIGIQTGLTGFGLSGKYNIDRNMAAQVIFSSWNLLGSSSTIVSGRGLYTFSHQYPLELYAGGEISYWMFSFGANNASSVGFGALVGLEYFLMPQLASNIEAGFRMVTIPGWFGSTSAGLAFGGGITYYL